MKLAAVGLGLTVVVTAILWLGWGRAAVVPGLTFGGLATGIQVAAVAAEAAGVQAAKVVRDADGDEVVVFFTAALGTEHDVMCLQIAP